MTLYFLNDVASDAESTRNFENYVMISSFMSETTDKLINRILGSSRQASRCQQAFSKPCLENLISKDSHLVFSIYLREFSWFGALIEKHVS